MGSILKRLINIARTESLHRLNKLGSRLFSEFRNERFEKEYRFSDSYSSNRESRGGEHSEFSGRKYDSHSRSSELPRQVIEDLGLFNLRPPSSLEEVKRARNREFKKYHSDKFINDPDKYQTSKEIMQIYNAAYERLREY